MSTSPSTRPSPPVPRPLVAVFAPAGQADAIALSGHHAEFVAAFEREVRRRSHRLLVCGTARPGDIGGLAFDTVGAVLVGYRDGEIDALDAPLSPVVCVDSYTTHPGFSVVRADDAEGGRKAAAHLLAHGHRDILFAGPADEGGGVVRERHRGFREVLAAAGVDDVNRRTTAGTSVREGVAVGRTLRSRHPSVTAVFATADTLATGILEGLALAGIRVPQDCSVIGFDDLELARAVSPKLTTIAQDVQRKAVLAAELVLCTAGRPAAASGPLSVGVELIARGTVGSPAPR